MCFSIGTRLSIYTWIGYSRSLCSAFFTPLLMSRFMIDRVDLLSITSLRIESTDFIEIFGDCYSAFCPT